MNKYSPDQRRTTTTGRFNAPLPTLGGRQLWADELVFRQWRIQRNTVTGHFRLLDEANVRRAWGSLNECRDKLEHVKSKRGLPPLAGSVVLALHGLFRSRSAMDRIRQYLDDTDDFTAMTVGYPSMRATVDEHARQLAHVVGHLDTVDQIHFVAHSLGNLVIRRWMHDLETGQATLPPGVRLGRFVMLGPPNHRPELAGHLGPWDAAGDLAGASARQLWHGWDALAPTLAVPKCEFGVLAGGTGRQGSNPLLVGDDDSVVTVASTRLAGARDFRVLNVRHTFMMNDATVQKMTLSFLRHGYFESAATRQPIGES